MLFIENMNLMKLVCVILTYPANQHINPYCRFSYAGTQELVNLVVGTNFATIFVTKTKYSEVKRQIDHGQTELSNMLVKKNVLNETNKEGIFTQGCKDFKKIKRMYLKIYKTFKTC